MARKSYWSSPGGARASDDLFELGRLAASLPKLDKPQLLLSWRNQLGGTAPAHLPGWLLARLLTFRLQAQTFGDVDPVVLRKLKRGEFAGDSDFVPFAVRSAATRDGANLRPGALLAREWRGKLERVTVLDEGFAWNGKTYAGLSQVAKAITGTNWNGHRFFGLRTGDAAANKDTIPKAARRALPNPRSDSHSEPRR